MKLKPIFELIAAPLSRLFSGEFTMGQDSILFPIAAMAVIIIWFVRDLKVRAEEAKKPWNGHYHGTIL